VVKGAQHAACTVEMASVVRPVDVAVVDEVQMMADPSRGHAFTRAVLGLPARVLHLCGDPAALPLLRQLVEDAGACLPAGCSPSLCRATSARTSARRYCLPCAQDIRPKMSHGFCA
jgi:hypothetical protein